MKYIENRLKYKREVSKTKIYLNDSYILNKINSIIKKPIKNIENINLSKEEYTQILSLIDEDFINKKNKIIADVIEDKYNKKSLNKFINKERYVNKNIKYYTNIVNAIESVIKKQNNIENNYVSYYFDNLVKDYLNHGFSKEKLITLKIIFMKITSLENKYSNISKRLAILTDNSNDVKRIVKYEMIKNKLDLERRKRQNILINSISQNIKILRLKTNEAISNGFFGL